VELYAPVSTTVEPGSKPSATTPSREPESLPFAHRPVRPQDKLLGVALGVATALVTVAITWWLTG
jgi:hypothetical protein